MHMRGPATATSFRPRIYPTVTTWTTRASAPRRPPTWSGVSATRTKSRSRALRRCGCTKVRACGRSVHRDPAVGRLEPCTSVRVSFVAFKHSLPHCNPGDFKRHWSITSWTVHCTILRRQNKLLSSISFRQKFRNFSLLKCWLMLPPNESYSASCRASVDLPNSQAYSTRSQR